MKIEELKELDAFKDGKIEKILNLDFMTEELLEELTELFPPETEKINGKSAKGKIPTQANKKVHKVTARDE